MADERLRGISQQDLEDREFAAFFRIVQSAALSAGNVFFLWSPEGNDGSVGDVWCEDLSGWLVPEDEADAFEAMWEARDDRIWAKEMEHHQAFARWSESDDGRVAVRFDFPLR